MKRTPAAVLWISALLLTACLPGASEGDSPSDIDKIVQATFVALTVQAAVDQGAPPAANPTGEVVNTLVPGGDASAGSGGISGKLSHPSGGVPLLLVVAFKVDSDEYYWMQTAKDQTTYTMDGLPAGTYHVVAYALPDGKMAGRYDQFYVCGLHQGCLDDGWIGVQVQAGAVTPNVDPGDWYLGEEYYPPMPSYETGQLSGNGIYSAPMPEGGGISGQLSFPSSFIPSMTVVAFEVGSANYRYVVTIENSSTYQIDDLPPGKYFVVAYPASDSSLPGGYSQAVPCGLLAGCTDHSLIAVTVNSGEVAAGINPGDFYAPPGTFPAYPLP